MIERQFGIEILPTWHDTPDMTEAAYIAEVRLELAKILRSKAGRALANSLQYQHQRVLVMPFEGGGCNAQEDGVTPGSKQSVVLFTPRILRRSPCQAGKRSQNNATLPHEVFFHELVHALRRISGNHRPARLKGKLMSYTHSEEFVAILATNIFIADRTNPQKTGLRANHQGHSSLEKELADSFHYFKNGTAAFHLIDNFCNQNRGFTRLLSQIRAPFNPIAAIYQNRRKAFEMAAAGDADSAFESLIPMDYFQAPSGAWHRIRPFPH
ncbi:hypothetical protein [Bryobacter aggregatus]|uniref:hypothetical protein n=1 Tax=Bryobacter aggregatus TaxID=360054 RepID=UPI0004E17A62|nr:hypothetical protein [Bryobacter aggregatus]